MDGKRFDKLATSLSSASSRRGVLRGLAAGGVASALAAVGIGLDEADARRRKHHKRHHKTQTLTISNTVNGLVEGTLCNKSKQCDEGLVCGVLGDNKKRCHQCGLDVGCAAGKCCLVGACVAGLDICI